MKKTPSINAIFEKVNDKYYEKNALLTQDILSYHYKVIRKNGINGSFRFWDLALWLVNNNLEFVTRYRGTHVRDSYKIENTKQSIHNKLEELIYLDLIRIKGVDKAQKVNTKIKTYEYTKGGQLLSWLIKGLDPKQPQDANNEIYELLTTIFKIREDSSSISIFRFLTKCKDKGNFDKLIEYIQHLLHQARSPEFKSMIDLVVYIFDSGFRDSPEQITFVDMWYETIRGLEPAIRKRMLHRMKLGIEIRFEKNQAFVSKQYEEFSVKLIANYRKFALAGYCDNCRKERNVSIHYLDYIKKFLLVASEDVKLKCPRCNKRDSITISNLF